MGSVELACDLAFDAAAAVCVLAEVAAAYDGLVSAGALTEPEGSLAFVPDLFN
jgi:hypothetical protein